MRYFSEKTIAGLLEQIDKHYVEELDKLPSIEIKEPHGRLIDADEVKKKKKHSYKEFCENVVSVYDIDNAPTVLEAST